MNIHVKLTELRIAHVTQKRQDFSRLFKILLFCLRTGSEPTELPEKQGSES